MGEVTLTLNGNQADIVRRGVAREAEESAKAIGRHVGGLVDGHFRRDSADYAREALAYCVKMLKSELAVLEQLPWSTEQEAATGLTTRAEAKAIATALTEKSKVAAA